MIIGITGTYASGKDAAARILQEMNFFHVSLSDLLREGLRRQGKAITRGSLITYGKQLRETEGADVLAKRSLRDVLDGENYVFTSIRSIGEVTLLKQREDFVLVNIVAPEKVRLQRLIARHREQDPATLAELRAREKQENSNAPGSQQLTAVARLAHVAIRNDSTLEALQKKLTRFVGDWLPKLQDTRPDWDTYFMNIAEQVKLRSTCMSAKKGALLVRNRMILSTGYNGSPKNITHCTAGGCKRCTARHLGRINSGKYSEPCICCHSEENAIVQAAYNGVSTQDATLYTTFVPCITCAKMIINAGIKEVVAKIDYPDDAGISLLREAKVVLRRI